MASKAGACECFDSTHALNNKKGECGVEIEPKHVRCRPCTKGNHLRVVCDEYVPAGTAPHLNRFCQRDGCGFHSNEHRIPAGVLGAKPAPFVIKVSQLTTGLVEEADRQTTAGSEPALRVGLQPNGETVGHDPTVAISHSATSTDEAVTVPPVQPLHGPWRTCRLCGRDEKDVRERLVNVRPVAGYRSGFTLILRCVDRWACRRRREDAGRSWPLIEADLPIPWRLGREDAGMDPTDLALDAHVGQSAAR